MSEDVTTSDLRKYFSTLDASALRIAATILDGSAKPMMREACAAKLIDIALRIEALHTTGA